MSKLHPTRGESAPDSDLHALVERSQAGDRGAAGQVLSWVQGPLRNLARRILPAGEVDDAVQDSLLKIFVALPRFDRRRKVRFTTWCHTIALNHCRDLLRRRLSARAVTHVGTPVAEDISYEPRRAAAGRELLRRYERALRELPEAQRCLLALREEGGLSYREIGVRLGVPIGTIRSRLSRLRQVLREQVEGSAALAS